MAFTFRKGTKLIIDDGTDRFEFIVASASASQTFIEASQNVKTIHNPNLVARTFVTEKGTANVSFSCYIGNGNAENSIFDWFGFEEAAGNYVIDPVAGGVAPKQYDIYIDAGSTIYKLDSCVAQNISFTLSRKELIRMDVTGVARDLVQVGSIPTTGTLFTQDASTFYNSTIDITGFSNISGVSCEITRNIQWLNQKAVHDIDSIYKVSNPVVTSLAISGTITRNKIDDTNDYVPNTAINISYGPTFKIILDDCNTTDRWDLSDIHSLMTDYKLLPTAASSYIKF